MPTLRELGARLYRIRTLWTDVDQIIGPHETWRERGSPSERVKVLREHRYRVDSLAEAQEIMFQCPACWVKNGGPVGTHYVAVGFHGRGLLPTESSHNRAGEPSRWHLTGTSLDDMSTTPSIDCSGGSCTFHGYITNGSAA